MNTFQAVRHSAAPAAGSNGDLDIGNVDERLEEEMRRLAAINQELLGGTRPDSHDAVDLSGDTDALAALGRENAELRARIEELEQALAASGAGDGSWAEQQREYEALLEEKSEVIRALHVKLQELQEGGSAPTTSSDDASATERLGTEMEEQRRQLEEDEESLMKQMREMEMAMSKDRAELARQRNEIQRLHNELNHEIETASRDGGLRDRLGALQKLQGELTGRKQTALVAPSPSPTAPPKAVEVPAKKKSNGLLGRIFGK